MPINLACFVYALHALHCTQQDHVLCAHAHNWPSIRSDRAEAGIDGSTGQSTKVVDL